MPDKPPFLLICGSSHVGKSTLAGNLAEALNWPLFSTDDMARHPGRPWQNSKPHVLEFYARLSDQTIYTLLRHHHDNTWPVIKRFIGDQLNAAKPFILEGSALKPTALGTYAANAVCLFANPDALQRRIRDQSQYDQQSVEMRHAIDTFIRRSLRHNAEWHAEALAHDIKCIDVTAPGALTQYQAIFIAATH
jgi:2-phosphoglycerate kinase